MILRFEVRNFRSFRGPTELSFVAAALRDDRQPLAQSQHAPHGVLPLVGLWGGNATGKTNLLIALLRTRLLVARSHIGLEPDQKLPWEPWGLNFDSAYPAGAELDLLAEGDVRYRFGFELDEHGFVAEWLHRYETKRRAVLYEREREAGGEPGDVEWYFGPSLTGQRQRHAEATRANALYLSVAAQNNHPELARVHRAIAHGIHPPRRIELEGFPLFERDDPMLSEAFRPTLLRLLRAADLGVSAVRVEEVEQRSTVTELADAERIFRADFLEELQRQSRDQPRLAALHLGHGGTGEAAFELPPGLESRGTNILLARLSSILRSLREGALLVVDELDTSLHPELGAELLRLFTDPRTNPARAQLVFTTHDPRLLQLLRRDEALLIDKGHDGVSVASSASDFRGLRARDDLRRAYEQGRLSGVPIVSDLAEALADEGGDGEG